MILISDDDICVRTMEDIDADYSLMLKWLTDDRILEFYDGRDSHYTFESIKEKYQPRIKGSVEITPCIIGYKQKPVGYIQYYPTNKNLPKDVDPLLNEEHVIGIDMFIGEADMWGRGIGSQALRLTVEYLFSKAHASHVMIDPNADNPRAIRTYEKAGFRKYKLLPGYEYHEGVMRDYWLMFHEKSLPAGFST